MLEKGMAHITGGSKMAGFMTADQLPGPSGFDYFEGYRKYLG